MLSLALATHLFLAGGPSGPAQLTVDVKPAGSQVMVDGKKVGTSGEKPIVLKLKPGKHALRVVYKGDAHNEEIVLKPGEKTTWKFEFEGTGPAAPPTDATPGQE